MIKKMKLYSVMVKEEKETPVCVKANTEERAVKLAHGIFNERNDDPRVLHGQVDNWVSYVTEVKEEEIK
tara:strand:- start:393 stop:599 length:207 start_codon:yes stop_codon:yes gene_type:complete